MLSDYTLCKTKLVYDPVVFSGVIYSKLLI